MHHQNGGIAIKIRRGQNVPNRSQFSLFVLTFKPQHEPWPFLMALPYWEILFPVINPIK